jgi:hypothetical protein
MTPTPRRLAIYERETVAPRVVTRTRLVFCPRQRRSLDPVECSTCDHAVRVTPGEVECFCDDAGVLPDVEVGIAASKTFECARAELPVTSFDELHPGVWPVPVVDASSRFVGFASQAAISEQLRGVGLPPRLAMKAPLGDLVFGASHVIWEGAPLYEGIKSLVTHHARSLAVIGPGRSLSGVLTDVEALHALKR